jgi:DNA/RNA-binding domain of Phe-tRNA-synthetase-like protein
MELPIKLALISIKNIQVSQNHDAFQNLTKLADSYYQKYYNTPIGQVYGVQEARTLFHSIGIDPTKHRPSSEALLRRALKQKEFIPVNTLVDIGNWCSLDFLLPICVYDANAIKGNISVRLGTENETYLAHNHREINLFNRFVICDEMGAFGSPITDSVRTAVNLSTSNAFMIIFAPLTCSFDLLQDHVSSFSERVFDYCGGAFHKVEYFSGKKECTI